MGYSSTPAYNSMSSTHAREYNQQKLRNITDAIQKTPYVFGHNFTNLV